MIRPPAVMSRAASWLNRRSGRALVERTQSHCFADNSSPSLSTPEAALLTRTSSCPATRPTSAIKRLIAEVGSVGGQLDVLVTDRNSTRLNSSHGYISYAVFCLKK